ncbi:MAG: phosphodiester glycosidase family protein [Trueperaceae bacterium]
MLRFALRGFKHLPTAKLGSSLAALTALLLLVPAPARAQSADDLYFRLPGAATTLTDDAITIRYGAYHETYVAGLGWLSGIAADAPVVRGGEVLVNSTVLDALSVALPRLEGVRTSGSAEVRVVLDLPGLSSTQLEGLRGSGRMRAGEELSFWLPPMLLPELVPDEVGGVLVQLAPEDGGTRLTVTGPALDYDVFPLANPTRLVLDLMPERDLTPVVHSERSLAAGVTYSRFSVHTTSGGSVVHVVRIEPAAGELRVVGESRVPRTTSELAAGALVALNAGYFDTTSFNAIGFLLVDHGLQSLPSRNRASIGFKSGQAPLIARLDVSIRLHTSHGAIDVGNAQLEGVDVVRTPGAFAGSGSRGVLLVADGVVVENKIGPRRVPEGGFALVYPPGNRAIALLDEGDRVILDTLIEPSEFGQVRYAVEAGPLLVQGGQPAFQPELELFATGQRILDGLTQQAAVGVTTDGATLLVVAETMRASELVPLFLSLGADRAMRLDSGSSTTLVIDGAAVNRRTERRVVSAIVLVPQVAGN